MVDESIHIKFDDKDPDNKMLQLVQKIAEIGVSEDTLGAKGPEGRSLEARNPSEVGDSEVDPTS